MSCRRLALAAVLSSFLLAAAGAAHGDAARLLRRLPTTGPGAHYTSNRPPLAPSPLVKLPIGAIEPRGLLRNMLLTEAQGMSGHLPELSRWCRMEGNAWADPAGKGHSGWEEMPYWLKGYGDLGLVLKDPRIQAESRRWVDAIIATQDADGWFGPRGLKTSLKGKPDLWPHMIALNILQSQFEATGDERVLPFMTRYFRWELNCPAEDFMTGYWPKMRTGDNLESVYWLYNRTGEAWLLELAHKIHKHDAGWSKDVINWHNVNIAQGFREPTTYWMQSKEQPFYDGAERNYRKVMDTYGQFPGGGFVGDENSRPGYTDPRGGFETCGIVEFMHSFEMLTKITGEPVWADRCEEIAFNSLPAAMTPDQRALHYLTCPNQVQLDKENKAPGIQNQGTMFSYSPGAAYRCCQHNVAHGWPYYAEELWLATIDRGLCASLYAASEVTAKVGAAGATVKLTEETGYPFEETVRLKVSTAQPVAFPLYLRIPRWCDAASIKVNGQDVAVKAESSAYVAIDRTWADGDTVTLTLPMRIVVRTWEKNAKAVSVERGPLAYSLKIGERWSKFGTDEKWPDWEVFPTTPWNYGLVLDAKDPAASFEVVRKPGALPEQPFTAAATPIELKAKARKIPGWKQDALGMVGKLRPSPVRSEEPEEPVTLIPMGAARLRISMFPTIGAGADAQEWGVPGVVATASHCNTSDTVEAMNDGSAPQNSGDRSLPRFTWWDHKGTAEWVQYDFAKPRKLASTSVYWFDDTGKGQCRVPASWRVLVKVGTEWKLVSAPGEGGVTRDRWNKVNFEAVETTGIRLEVKLRDGVSGGILEWTAE